MKLEFNGQVILMAGGTCGTGRVIAEVLAGNAPLGVVTDFTSLDSAQSTVAGAETVGREALGIQADVTRELEE